MKTFAYIYNNEIWSPSHDINLINCSLYCFSDIERYKANFIVGTFDWRKSPEGVPYWSKVNTFWIHLFRRICENF